MYEYARYRELIDIIVFKRNTNDMEEKTHNYNPRGYLMSSAFLT